MIKVCRNTASWQKTNSNSWVMIIVMMAILITEYNSTLTLAGVQPLWRSSSVRLYLFVHSSFFLLYENTLLFLLSLCLIFTGEPYAYALFYSHSTRTPSVLSSTLHFFHSLHFFVFWLWLLVAVPTACFDLFFSLHVCVPFRDDKWKSETVIRFRNTLLFDLMRA